MSLLGGGSLGCAAGLFFARLEFADLALADSSDRWLSIAGLGGLGAGVAAAFLLPVAALSAFIMRFGWRAWMPGYAFYAGTLAVGGAAAAGYFYTAFNLVRDPKGPLGVGVVIAVSVALMLALGIVGRLTSPGTVLGRHRWVPFVGLGVALVFIAVLPPVDDRAAPASRSETAPTVATEAAGPSVLLISIDTLRADHVGAYGYERATTPNIDRLAGAGVLFERAYALSSWTLPSHASLLTGLDTTGHGVRFTDNVSVFGSRISDRLEEWNVTLAELLAAAGYRTAGFTASRWLSPAFGFDQGFEILDADREGHTASELADTAISWIESVGGESFFLFLHLFDVHDYAAPPEHFARFHPEPYEGKVRNWEWKAWGNLWQSLSPADLRYLVARYDGALLHVDEELGRLFAHLDELGLLDEMLVIVTSDHGEEFLDHDATGHGQTLYEEQLRVPLIMKTPQSKEREQRVGDVIALTDVVPTVLDYVGVRAPLGLHGASVRDLLSERGEAPRRRFVFGSTFLQNHAAVLDGEHKLVVNRLPPLEPFDLRRWLVNLRTFYKFKGDELYNVAADPDEQRNLVADQSRLAARLRRDLHDRLLHGRSGRAQEMDQDTVDRLRALGYLR